MSNFNTVVFGASTNPERYAYKAVNRLIDHCFEVIPLGFRKGSISNIEILTDWPKHIDDLKVVTLYVGPARQPEFYEYIISLKPEVVIFNPGTENVSFYELLTAANIKYEEACTLVLLGTGAYKNL